MALELCKVNAMDFKHFYFEYKPFNKTVCIMNRFTMNTLIPIDCKFARKFEPNAMNTKIP